MPQNFLELRGVTIKEDGEGKICLNDLWRLASEPGMKTPPRWRALPTIKNLIEAFVQNIEKFDVLAEKEEGSAIYSKSGKGGGTYAHPVLALTYAEYLSDDLAIEVKSVYLRYRSGDLTLVDEVLAKSDAARKHHETRDVSKQIRVRYAATLTRHGAGGKAIGYCTDAIYEVILGGTTKEVLTDRKLPVTASLRDNLSIEHLLQTMNTEHIASERIEDLEIYGKEPCAQASRRAAKFIQDAFDKERQDRRNPDPSISNG